MVAELIMFSDEASEAPAWGILIDNSIIVCLCCGGLLNIEDVDIIMKCPYEWIDIDAMLTDFFEERNNNEMSEV